MSKILILRHPCHFGMANFYVGCIRICLPQIGVPLFMSTLTLYSYFLISAINKFLNGLRTSILLAFFYVACFIKIKPHEDFYKIGKASTYTPHGGI